MRDLWTILSTPDRHADPYTWLAAALAHNWLGIAAGWVLISVADGMGLSARGGALDLAASAIAGLVVGLVYLAVKEIADMLKGGKVSDSFHDTIAVGLGGGVGAMLPPLAVVWLSITAALALWGVTVRIREQTHEQ